MPFNEKNWPAGTKYNRRQDGTEEIVLPQPANTAKFFTDQKKQDQQARKAAEKAAEDLVFAQALNETSLQGSTEKEPVSKPDSDDGRRSQRKFPTHQEKLVQQRREKIKDKYEQREVSL
jgi:hypothetical protein